MAFDKSIFKGARESFLNAKELQGEGQCLWPAPYNNGSYEARKAFIYDCIWTFNADSGDPERIPQKDYIDCFIWEWTESKRTGQPFVVVKSRQMIISWLCRALELHDAGLKQSLHLLAGVTYTTAGKQTWRVWYMYEQLRKRFGAWKLRPAKTWDGAPEGKEIGSIVLSNGSKIESINQDGESFRGDGVTSACLEEGSTYSNLADSWTQAVIVCQGRAGGVGGHKTLIANASPNEEFLELIAA